MDSPDLDEPAHRHALDGLARINRWSRSDACIFRALEALFPGRRELRVLDLAAGAGDVTCGLWLRSRGAGLDWSVAGCDVSPVALACARERAARLRADVPFFARDVLAEPLPERYDVAVSSLFLHHLDDAQAGALLGRMAGCGALVIDDLVRGPGGLLMAALGSRVLTRSAVVHADAALSVRNAFTLAEARDLAARAGLAGARIARHWPFRFTLSWRRA